ncbi:MAG: hypothetical protein K8I60_02570 [Anaerolineae bacterium]|nr:hypothetical protein [Anaerolineae bacterium]
MKHLVLIFVLILVAAVGVIPAAAQDSNVITLNDASPAIDVVITLPADTTGTIALNFVQAAITLTDATGNTVFYAADQRLHGLELNIPPNSGTHTLKVERLLGAAEAQVSVVSLPELTQSSLPVLVNSTSVGLNQAAEVALDANSPGSTVTVNVPADTVGVITATFPGASATTQLVDANGVVMAQSFGGQVDGLNYVLDGGDYQFTVLGNSLTSPVIAGVSATAADQGGFVVLATPVPTTAAPANTVASCTATINVSSVNLRSGPGTGYSVMDYGYRSETYPVGGRNPENNWIVIGTDTGSAWVALTGAQLSGACDNLAVYNVPLRDAQPAQVIITSPQQPGQFSGGNTGGDGEHEDDEHEDDEHDD